MRDMLAGTPVGTSSRGDDFPERRHAGRDATLAQPALEVAGHAGKAGQMSPMVRSLPADITQTSVVILTACAVLMLEWTAPHASVVTAGA